MQRQLLATTMFLLLGVLFTARPAHATEPAEAWNPSWRRANAVEYVGAPVAIAALVAEDLVFYKSPPPARWQRPILFDESVRNGLASRTPEGQERAGTVSWSLLVPLLAMPLVDAGIAGLRGRSDLAWELFWEDALVLPIAGLVDVALRDVVGRARPPVSECLAQNHGDTAVCLGSNEDTRSFPGGHFAAATAGTMLVCAQHLELGLYGGPWDAITCVTAASADVTVGVLRIVADRHWASDIIVGGALGGAIGLGVPAFLHSRGRAEPADSTVVRWMPTPLVLPAGGGVGVTGMF